jgi:tripartite-type tricarboxylate transporter receptor subunit TctC
MAQDYPVRPVKVIVPYAPGGVPDVIARVVGQRLSERLGQQFVVENRGGGAGISAVMAVARAAPDGYTLLLTDNAVTTINPYLFDNLPYDTLRDLAPVSNIANTTQFVVAHAAQFGSFTELVAYAKANPGRLSYGSPGMGTVHHIGTEAIKTALGIDIVHVPYKGSGQSVPAFLAGQIPIVIASLPALAAHVKSGKARLLAVASPRRNAQAPDVPALAEFIPGYDYTVAIGLYAPAGTPSAIVTRIAAEVAKAVQHPETVARFTPLGIDPVGSTPDAFVAVIRRDLERYSTAVKSSGARAN